MGNALNPVQRQQDLAALAAEDFDVVVIGGGVTGAGIALDAASRGLRTAIVEAQDWASGTSSRSSGLVHGGLRYLYRFDLPLVSEALRERGLLLNTIAPHLVKPQTFLWPLRTRVLERAYSTVGVGIYDALSLARAGRTMPGQRHRSRSGVLARFPDIQETSLVGAIEFHDARVDDARLVITLVRTALEYGARAVSRVAATRIHRAADGPVTGLTVQDLASGDSVQVRTRGVIAATGVWTEETQALADAGNSLRVLASKGVHIVVPKDRIQSETGIFLRTEKSVLFMIPWQHHWLIGTTDTAWHEPLQHPVPTSRDIDYLLGQANQVLAKPLTREDLIGSYAGLRPLLHQRRKADVRTTKISREHSVATVVPGMVAIAGGKLTTYRVMAKDAVDHLLGKRAAAERPSVTHRTPLLGAQGLAAMTNQSERIGSIYGWNPAMMTHLLDRHGSELPDLLAMVDDDPTLAAPLVAAPEYLRVEVARACTVEGALHLEDILIQRIRLNTEHRDRGLAAAREVAAIAAPLLGWDDARMAREVANYSSRVNAEVAAQSELTDHAASVTRLRARDIVPSPVR